MKLLLNNLFSKGGLGYTVAGIAVAGLTILYPEASSYELPHGVENFLYIVSGALAMFRK